MRCQGNFDDYAALLRLGGQAPSHLPRWLLLRLLAHRLQTQALGDLDRSVRKMSAQREATGSLLASTSARPETRQGISLKPGALLVREWQGKLERVMVLEEGFAWNGKSYRQPVADRQGDDRDKLERSSLLWPAAGQGSLDRE